MSDVLEDSRSNKGTIAPYSIQPEPVSSAMLGDVPPSEFLRRARRQSAFLTAFHEASAEAYELAEEGELDPPNSEAWQKVLRVTAPFTRFINAPMVTPMQMGGVSVSWHEFGLDIEFRARDGDSLLTIASDTQDEIQDFFDYDKDGRVAQKVLLELVFRTAAI